MLGWPHDIDDDGDVVLHAPPGAGPNWIFIAVSDEKVVKNRIHLDFRPDDQQAEVERVIGLGARHVDIGQGDAELGGAGRSRGQRVLHPRRRRLISYREGAQTAVQKRRVEPQTRTLAGT